MDTPPASPLQTIALVDDDRNILTSVSIALENEGYRIQTYTDGATALDGLKQNPPDLAIFDIKMPRMDGMELLRRLRQKSDIPVIFLTSKDEEIAEAVVDRMAWASNCEEETFRANRAEFLLAVMAAVDRVSTISSERGRAVKLALSDGRLTLSVTNPDSGSATEEIEVDYDAGPLEIGFNARYLLDITSQLDSDTALFKLADPGSPTLIQDRDGAAALYVLMPMRV